MLLNLLHFVRASRGKLFELCLNTFVQCLAPIKAGWFENKETAAATHRGYRLGTPLFKHSQILLKPRAPVVRGERQRELLSLTYHLPLRRAESLTSLSKELVATCLLYLISAVSSSEHFPFVFKWKPFVAQGQIIEVTRLPAGVYLLLCAASCRQKY